MKFDAAVLDQLAEALAQAGYLSTPSMIEERIRTMVSQASSSRGSWKEGGFSISRALRGLAAGDNRTITAATRDEDLGYAKRTLLTGTTPGSYLVPTIQADQIVELLTSANIIRASGARIWPMNGIQKLNVPVATAAPTIVWGDSSGSGGGGQGQTLTPSDPNLSQMIFDLRSQKTLVAIPNELIAVSTPAVDQVVSELIGLSMAQDEMNAFVATSAGTGKPQTVYGASGTTKVNANGNSANGGAIKYTDLLGAVASFYTAKGKGNPAWFMHPKIWFNDILGIVDSNGRPVVSGLDSLQGPFKGTLFGFPVYLSAEFPVNQSVGSGSNQSYVVFTNPQYLHVATPSGLELAVSFERFFDSNETAVRGINRVDFGFSPAAAIIILAGCNV